MIVQCSKCKKDLLTEADPFLTVPVDNYAVVCYDCVVKNFKEKLSILYGKISYMCERKRCERLSCEGCSRLEQ